ncbi:hypothetical protein [Mycobacteroides abscessus]|uniref:Uncharacterized protein n=1 Tax=Mycobacteroides abscessus subsp. abscessus TaxID=1185650 RepID=A0AB38CVG3_9MYCO|nr:hypothetical protein [Mycobacteroides abscessus]SHZ98694.1 Uncharacterised protein [Mycobacteroides abscessus subsp. abscessus]SIA43760.1 Uncharacterised protein [Mycobacteroides abscessus subsp. abscessus]SIA52253.1 Uncharacterised protein [Mycobacteroides abscessus subsp. abscessus]SIA53000.1 Uncharacterised protein [Mycobacteroides abscessus subsp. abscessus]SKO66215.1 Uncharacterised protein [Mycobacteroides abscessus subsp. abscessus]
MTNNNRVVTVTLPEQTPSNYYPAAWKVPLTCSMTGQKLTDFRASEVNIRNTDGRISFSGIPSVIDNADDAEAIAAALLAAARYLRSKANG